MKIQGMNIYDFVKEIDARGYSALPWGYIHVHVYSHYSQTSLLVFTYMYLISQVSVYSPLVLSFDPKHYIVVGEPTMF